MKHLGLPGSPCASSHCRYAFAAFAFALGLASTVSTPAYAGRLRFHLARVDDVEAYFDFLVGADLERYDVAGPTPPRTARKLFLGQRLGLFARGFFVHPRLMVWSGLADILFIEDLLGGNLPSLVSDGQSPTSGPARTAGTRFGVEPEYDVQLHILPQHPYPVTLYSSRHTTLVRRQFLGNYWVTSWQAGAQAQWHNRVIPLSVQYNYVHNVGDPRELSSGVDEHGVVVTAQRHVDRASTRVEYRLTDYRNRYYPESNSLLHYGVLWSQLDLDAKGDYRADVLLRGQHREFYELRQDEVRTTDLLVARFLPSLEMRLQGDLAWLRDNELDTFETGAWWSLRHELFLSLTSEASARVLYDRTADGDSLEGVVGGAISYRKHVGPFVMMHAYDVQATWNRVRGSGAFVQSVFDERVVLEGFLPQRLANRGIRLDSVRVVDERHAKTYVRNRDYALEQDGDFTLIRRMQGGDIPDGAVVYVSYEYLPPVGMLTRLVDQRYVGRLETDFSRWFRLYAEYGFRSERDSGTEGAVHRKYHEVVAGLEANGAGLVAAAEYRLQLFAEYHGQQVSASLTYTFPFSSVFRPIVGVRDTYLRIDTGNVETNVLSFFSDANFPIVEPIEAEWHISYDWEQGGPYGGHFVLGTARIVWPIRKVRLWLEYNVDIQRREMQDYDRHAITFNARREF